MSRRVQALGVMLASGLPSGVCAASHSGSTGPYVIVAFSLQPTVTVSLRAASRRDNHTRPTHCHFAHCLYCEGIALMYALIAPFHGPRPGRKLWRIPHFVNWDLEVIALY